SLARLPLPGPWDGPFLDLVHELADPVIQRGDLPLVLAHLVFEGFQLFEKPGVGDQQDHQHRCRHPLEHHSDAPLSDWKDWTSTSPSLCTPYRFLPGEGGACQWFPPGAPETGPEPCNTGPCHRLGGKGGQGVQRGLWAVMLLAGT